ncbi:MAG: cell division protein FtsZ [Bacteroidetes bacterium]|nr:MAG: cell division protein FtsZ [Bacteroidota bacterium]
MIFKLLEDSNETPIIKVLGVGGGGSNAVTHMYKQGIVGVDFAICNTDNQAMEISPVPTKIRLGPALTEGRGAGSKPNIGKQACEESIEEVREYLSKDCKMLFITAGMGGGTGTGAAPIIAKAAQEMDILTVGIVTVPFTFEGRRRQTQAHEGLDELKKNVDTLIIISNDKLREMHGNLKISEAFAKADNILTTAAKGIAEIITVPGYVNVDFEDVNTVMRGSGVAIMGTAVAEGDDRAKKAVDEALSSPLLEENNIRGAQHILLNVTSGTREVTMDEIFEITEFVQEEAGYGTDLIWGNCYDESLGDKISVTVIATGFERNTGANKLMDQKEKKIVVSLDEDDNPPKKKGLTSIGFESETEASNAPTFEFDDIRPTVERYHKNGRYSYEEPYIKEEDKERREAERRRQIEAERRRRERLRDFQVKLNSPKVVNELENTPAYLRRGVNLDNVPHSSDESMSRYTISDDADGEPEIKPGNSFLHDNVD